MYIGRTPHAAVGDGDQGIFLREADGSGESREAPLAGRARSFSLWVFTLVGMDSLCLCPRTVLINCSSALVSNSELPLDHANVFLFLPFPVNGSSQSAKVHMKATLACHRNLLKKCRLRLTLGLPIGSGGQRKSQKLSDISRDSLRRF